MFDLEFTHLFEVLYLLNELTDLFDYVFTEFCCHLTEKVQIYRRDENDDTE